MTRVGFDDVPPERIVVAIVSLLKNATGPCGVPLGEVVYSAIGSHSDCIGAASSATNQNARTSSHCNEVFRVTVTHATAPKRLDAKNRGVK